jgi:hypothetical protein
MSNLRRSAQVGTPVGLCPIACEQPINSVSPHYGGSQYRSPIQTINAMSDLKSPLERFTRWFIEPIEALKNVKGGGGAFVAMSVGFFLCERYFRSFTGVGDDQSGAASQTFKAAAAARFDVNATWFSHFWTIYRHGMQHQGSPKNDTIGGAGGISYRWLVDGGFPDMPARWVNGGHTYICINPWGFTQRMIDLFLNDEARIGELGTHQLGEVFEPKVKVTPTLVKAGDAYP